MNVCDCLRCASRMSRQLQHLVSATWLKSAMVKPHHNIKLIEVAFVPTQKEEFVKSHIPGAQFCNLQRHAQVTSLIPCNLPARAPLESDLGGLGVNDDSHVVLYDRAEMQFACRAWWTLRFYGLKQVSVLDGGWEKWVNDGQPTESGEGKTQQQGLVRLGSGDDSMLATFEDIVEASRKGTPLIVDTRLPQNFYEEKPEPSPMSTLAFQITNQAVPPMIGGHFPKSVNVPFSEFHNKDKCLINKEKFLEVLQQAGVDPDLPAMATCYGGMWATVFGLLMKHHLGKDVPNYLGSWTEAGQRLKSSL